MYIIQSANFFDLDTINLEIYFVANDTNQNST